MTSENDERKKHTTKKKTSQDVRREDNNKRKTKNRNIEIRATSSGPKQEDLLAFVLGFFFWCLFYVETKNCFPLKKRVQL